MRKKNSNMVWVLRHMHRTNGRYIRCTKCSKFVIGQKLNDHNRHKTIEFSCFFALTETKWKDWEKKIVEMHRTTARQINAAPFSYPSRLPFSIPHCNNCKVRFKMIENFDFSFHCSEKKNPTKIRWTYRHLRETWTNILFNEFYDQS